MSHSRRNRGSVMPTDINNYWIKPNSYFDVQKRIRVVMYQTNERMELTSGRDRNVLSVDYK